jgi:POT family proton-dependent oligopeptide transporter
VGISIGAMLSGFVVGWVAEAFGWHFGFAVGAAGMTMAFCSYVLLAPRWFGSIGLLPDGHAPPAAAPEAAAPARTNALRRIALLFVLACLLCAFSAGWFQIFGSWLLFIERDVDRAIGAFVIPVPWFASMNAAVVFVSAPLVNALWKWLEARNQRVDIVQKYIFALSMVAGGHVLMYLAARQAAPTAPASLWIPLISLSMLAIGELVAWTATYGMVSRAAPAGFASVAMGAWYLLTLGLGGYLSGSTGRLIDSAGFAATFGAVAIVMGGVCVIAVLLRNPLSRLAGRAGVTL